MNSPAQFKLVVPGIMGEPEVLRALLGPDAKVSQIQLEGYELRLQTEIPDDVRELLDKDWDKKGIPYPGAYTLVPKEGATAMVGCVDFSSQDEVKKAIERVDYWDFHKRKHGETNEAPIRSPWFRYRSRTEGSGDGKVVYLIEELADKSAKTEVVGDGYRETEGYRKGVNAMVEQANTYRMSLEGAATGVEGKA